MNATTKFRGHLCALFCVIVWGITFIVSAKLLVVFTPIQTMLLRFFVAYLVLWVLHPKWYFRWQDEVAFLLMSIFSNTLYFMAENTAITYTQSSNVSILVSTAPVLTAILLALTPGSEKPTRNTVLGILVALVGMVMVVLNGAVVLKLNPIGDLLSVGAALSWAVYSLILQRYSSRFSSYLISRKLMFYGILTTLPLLAMEGAPFPISTLFTQPTLLLGLLFLAVLGSALCYVCWNSGGRTRWGCSRPPCTSMPSPSSPWSAPPSIWTRPSPSWASAERFSSCWAWCSAPNQSSGTHNKNHRCIITQRWFVLIICR